MAEIALEEDDACGRRLEEGAVVIIENREGLSR